MIFAIEHVLGDDETILPTQSVTVDATGVAYSYPFQVDDRSVRTPMSSQHTEARHAGRLGKIIGRDGNIPSEGVG